MTHTYDKPLHGSFFSKRAINLPSRRCMFGGTALITRRYYVSHFFASSAETRLLSPKIGTRPAPVSELLHQQQTTAILQESVICIAYIKAMEGVILRRSAAIFQHFSGDPAECALAAYAYASLCIICRNLLSAVRSFCLLV